MLGEKPLHCGSVSLRQFAEGPRHCFDDHVVTIASEQATDFKRTRGVTASASSLVVEWHGANECSPSPPSVPRVRPAMNERIGDLTLAPRGSREVAGKHINRAPATES